MVDPLFWLGLSILFVAVSLAAVLIAALPALQELARAARSAEKLFDTLSRELPPTLEAIRLTGMEITTLTEDVNQNVQAAGRVVEQIDQGLSGAKQQARQAQVTTRSVVAGFKAAWQKFNQPAHPRKRESDRLASASLPIDLAKQAATENPFETAFNEAELLEDERIRYSERESRPSERGIKPSETSEYRQRRNDRRRD